MKRLLLWLLIILLFANVLVYSVLLWPRQSHSSFLETLALQTPQGQRVFAFLVHRIFSPYWFSQQPVNPLHLLPAHTVVVLDLRHAFALEKLMPPINWPVILDRLELKEQFRQPIEQASRTLTHPLVQELLKHRSVFVLAPSPLVAEQSIVEHLLLIVQPAEEQGYHDILSLLIQGNAPHVHHGLAVHRLELSPQHSLYAAAIGKTFTLSLSLALVEESIDRFLSHLIFRRPLGTLAKDLHQQDWDAFALYVDLVGLQNFTGEEENRYSVAQDLFLFHKKGRTAEHVHSRIRFIPKAVSPMKNFYSVAPLVDRSFAKMPAQLLLYFWSNWLEPKAWWNLYASQSQEAAVGRVAAWLEQQTGMELEAFFALFGNELALNITDISTAGFFPVPQICFALEVQDKNKVEEFLKYLLTGLPIKRDTVAGFPVVSLQAAQGLMQPSYLFVEDLLFLADSKEQLVDILDESSPKMLHDPVFQALNLDMSQPANFFLFARMAGLVDGMKELAAWFGTMITIRNQAAGAKSKILVDQVLSPLLENLRTYEALGVRSLVRADELVVELVLVPVPAQPEEL